MDITICENLRKYRKDKGNTQEELAEYIGISIQAVSKWERNEGFPDITLLPKIAAYYNVSVDDLLGVGKIRQREKIDEYEKRAMKYRNIGDTENNLKIWREAIQEFPNDLRVINEYMYALPDDNEKDANEKIKLAERLIKESTDEENYNSGAMQILCYTYKALGDIETAKKYAGTLPNYHVTQNQIMITLLKSEEAAKYIQGNLATLTDLIYLNILNLARQGNYKPDEKIRLYEYSLKLFDLLFEGDYGFYYNRTYDLYCKIAANYAKLKDLENTVQNLDAAAGHAVKDITKPDGVYKSIFANLTDHKKEYVSTNSMDNSAFWLLKSMEEDVFDFCRNDNGFKAIAEMLQNYAGKRE